MEKHYKLKDILPLIGRPGLSVAGLGAELERRMPDDDIIRGARRILYTLIENGLVRGPSPLTNRSMGDYELIIERIDEKVRNAIICLPSKEIVYL